MEILKVLYENTAERSTSAIAIGDALNLGKKVLCLGDTEGNLKIYNIDEKFEEITATRASGSILAIQIADADNDGRNEIVVGCSIGPKKTPGEAPTFQIFRFENNKLNLVTELNIDRFVTSVGVACCNGDGENEVIIGASDSTIRIYKLRGSTLNPITVIKQEDMPLSIGIADVDGDEIKEVVTGNKDNTLRAYRIEDSSAQEIIKIHLTKPVISIASGDLIGDRKEELGIVTADGTIKIFRNEESKLVDFTELLDARARFIKIKEISGDHMAEIISITADKKVEIYNMQMAQLAKLAELDIGAKTLALAVGDVNNDNLNEIAIGTLGKSVMILKGIYKLNINFKVPMKIRLGQETDAKLTITNITEYPIQNVSGKIYWYPKENITIAPIEIKIPKLEPNEKKEFAIKITGNIVGTSIIRPLVIKFTDRNGIEHRASINEIPVYVSEEEVAAPEIEAAIQQAEAVTTEPMSVSESKQIIQDEIEAAKAFLETIDTLIKSPTQASSSTTSEGTVSKEPTIEASATETIPEVSPFSSTSEISTEPASTEPLEIPEHALFAPQKSEEPLFESTTEQKVEEKPQPCTSPFKDVPPKPRKPGRPEDSYDYLFKAVVLGEGAVGKTSLVNRFATGQFTTDYKVTVGSQFAVKLTDIYPPDSDYAIRVKLQVWDLAGQERFQGVRNLYYAGASGGLLVYDVTRRRSFLALEKWLQEADKSIGRRVPFIVVGNKIDLPDRVVSFEEGKEWADKHGFLYCESSAKTGENVADIFKIVAEIMWLDVKKRQKK